MVESVPFESAPQTGVFAKRILIAAGVYSLLFGMVVVLFPAFAFELAGMRIPTYPQIWQTVGIIVGVYGVGYLIASQNPVRFWPIVLVGLLGKVLVPIGFLFYAFNGDLPWSWAGLIVLNDVIWWIPFTMILYQSFYAGSNTAIGNPHDIDDATLIFASNHGKNLVELSHEQPVMVIFLRHFGCSFCREALQDLSRSQKEFEELGMNIALVHMGQPAEADAITKKYHLEKVDSFSDDTCEIYRAFGIERGSFWQLFGPKVIWRGMVASLKGNIAGALAGDAFRMPGIVMLYRGEILGSYRHRNASDRPDYTELARRFAEVSTVA